MDKETFEKLMYEEWRDQVFKPALQHSENTRFDLLWDLRNNLYDIFHPLGISGNGIHDVARVTGDVLYAFLDDGDLSIVAAYTKDHDGLLPDHERFDFFVCRGFCTELTKEGVSVHALRHCQTRTMTRFVAKRFNDDVLNKLHEMKPQFDKERKLVDWDNIEEYVYTRQENEQKIENMILGLER